jgi:sugar lactone lactonase YvrE
LEQFTVRKKLLTKQTLTTMKEYPKPQGSRNTIRTIQSKSIYRHASVAMLALAVTLLAGSAPSRADIIYVSNGCNNTIEKFDSVTGTNLGVFASTALGPGLSSPEGLAFDSAGNLYVAMTWGPAIEKFTPGGGGSVFATNILCQPNGLAFDSAGNLYVANSCSSPSSIAKFTPDGVGSIFATDRLSSPQGLAIDSAGNIYAANYNTGTIMKFTPEGVGSMFATNLSHPGGLTFDSAGNLFVANYLGFNILKFTPSGARSVFANTAQAPFGLAFDSAGNLYVIDPWTIEKFSPTGADLGVFASVGIACLSGIAIQPTSTQQTNTPPQLGITTVSNLPVVVWPAAATNCVLQTTTNLASGNWVTVSNGIPFTGVMVTNASSSAFFRLSY